MHFRIARFFERSAQTFLNVCQIGGEDPPPSLDTERAKYTLYQGRVPQTALPAKRTNYSLQGGRNAPISPLGAGGPKTLLPQLQKAVNFGPASTMQPPGHT